MESKEAIQYIELHLMEFFPETYLNRHVKSIHDLYQNRVFLRQLPCTDFTLSYIVDIVFNTVVNKERFRVQECLRVIKSIVKRNESGISFNPQIIEKLFFLYQQYIFHSNEQIQWCVSVFLKGQILTDHQIEWLIANFEKSDHIVNRLLRYPEKNNLIKAWANYIYRQNLLTTRKAEVIGLLIDETIPDFINEDSETMMWAIFYSQTTDEIKQDLLFKYLNLNNVETFVELCMRLNYPESMAQALLVLKESR